MAFPSKNEAKRIAYALRSLEMQTYKPEMVVVVDDGSEDDTSEVAGLIGSFLDTNTEIIRKPKSEGKTAAVKYALRNCSSDKIFVLDADTVLESPDYIEKLISPHYRDDVASSYGIVKPLTEGHRKCFLKELSHFLCDNQELTSRAQQIKRAILYLEQDIGNST
jgi:glycosyltransferase involved in cell wall biosynthesis